MKNYLENNAGYQHLTHFSIEVKSVRVKEKGNGKSNSKSDIKKEILMKLLKKIVSSAARKSGASQAF